MTLSDLVSKFDNGPFSLNFQQLNQRHPNTKKAAEGESVADGANTEMNYFNTSKTHPQPSSYNQTFHFDPGYNAKLKRDDMQYSQVCLGDVMVM